jgi:hypothetical protein
VPEPVDCEVKIRLTGSQYLAMRHLAEINDRSLTAELRHAIRLYLTQASADLSARDRAALGADRE